MNSRPIQVRAAGQPNTFLVAFAAAALFWRAVIRNVDQAGAHFANDIDFGAEFCMLCGAD